MMFQILISPLIGQMVPFQLRNQFVVLIIESLYLVDLQLPKKRYVPCSDHHRTSVMTGWVSMSTVTGPVCIPCPEMNKKVFKVKLHTPHEHFTSLDSLTPRFFFIAKSPQQSYSICFSVGVTPVAHSLSLMLPSPCQCLALMVR